MEFALSIPQLQSPTFLALGESTNIKLVLSLIGGVGTPVTLDVSGHPEGVTFEFSVNPETPKMGEGASILLIISAESPALPGIYLVTITGESDLTSQQVTIDLLLLHGGDDGGGGGGGGGGPGHDTVDYIGN